MSMYKIMIVDDEALVRKGIATSIDWEDFGIQVVAEAANGQEALHKLNDHPIDLVLTDIRMPVMSGIELSHRIREIYPDMAVVLLSGYEDFSYARSAMKLGIKNYLLKPVSAEELINVITEIRDRKREELLNKRKDISRNQIFNENLPDIKRRVMESILKKELMLTEITEILRILKIELIGSKYLVLSIDIDNFYLITKDMTAKETEAYKYAVYNIIEETIVSYFPGFVCYGELDKLTALVSVNTSASILDVCKEIQFNIKKYMKLTVTIGVGLSRDSLLDINESYKEANQALKEKAYRGKGNIYLYTGEVQSRRIAESYTPRTSEEKTLVQYFKLMDTKELHEKMNQYFSSLAVQKISFEALKHNCIRLMYLFINQLEEIGIPLDKVFHAPFIPHVAIERFEVMKDLQDWMVQTTDKMVNSMQVDQHNSSKRIVKEAIAYIEGHYDEPLSLSDVAAHVNVTPPYLSKLFKEEMQITFTKWLNQFRVEKAKELLRMTRLKTYEIAEKVGYYDYKYFSNTFRKYTGVSPREFRNR